MKKVLLLSLLILSAISCKKKDPEPTKEDPRLIAVRNSLIGTWECISAYSCYGVTLTFDENKLTRKSKTYTNSFEYKVISMDKYVEYFNHPTQGLMGDTTWIFYDGEKVGDSLTVQYSLTNAPKMYFKRAK